MIFLSVIDILETNWHIFLLFFTVALLYSSVGFGGGSSYLAILAITGFAYTQIRSTALLCNIIVVSGNVILYYRQQVFNWKKAIPLVLFSIPFSFIGGYLKISQIFFFIFLAFILLFAAIIMWMSEKNTTHLKKSTDLSLSKNAGYGSIIGFVSGMSGIGGGIFLAPLLHLTNWGNSKKIAATASFFILVNSIAGLLGQYSNANFDVNWQLTTYLLITVFIGGQIGHNISSTFFSSIQLKKATALLIAFVSIRLLINYCF